MQLGQAETVGAGWEEMGKDEILRINGAIVSEMCIAETKQKSLGMFRGSCVEKIEMGCS